MKVKPAIEGAVIRDPQTRIPLPAAGGEVPDSSFWRRRLRAGDVVEIGDMPMVIGPVQPLTTREV